MSAGSRLVCHCGPTKPCLQYFVNGRHHGHPRLVLRGDVWAGRVKRIFRSALGHRSHHVLQSVTCRTSLQGPCWALCLRSEVHRCFSLLETSTLSAAGFVLLTTFRAGGAGEGAHTVLVGSSRQKSSCVERISGIGNDLPDCKC